MDLFGDLPEPGSRCDALMNPGVNINGENNKDVHLGEPQDILRGEKRKNDGLGCYDQLLTTKRRSSVKYTLHGYVTSLKGEREEMQNAHILSDNAGRELPRQHPSICRIAVYGMFDGHGGARASRFASENLHINLLDKFPQGDMRHVEKEIKKIFLEAFKKTDNDFLREAKKCKPAWKDGTTALIVLALNDTLYIANLGDSKAVLCRYKDELKKHVPVPLSTVHNPSVYEERIRIQKSGGQVRDGRVMGALAVSRSIGDGQYKNHGVICLPDLKKCQLTDKDRFLMIACDGLWKCFTEEESIKFVCDILENKSIQGTDAKNAEEVRYETACNRLVNEAVLRLSADNVTVVLVSVSSSV